MSPRVIRVIFVTISVLYAGVVLFSVASGYRDGAGLLWMLVLVPGFMVAGGILIFRRPGHPIGTLLTLSALTMFALPTMLEVPTLIAYENSGVQTWMWLPLWLVMTLTAAGTVLISSLIMLLPDGKIRFRRERYAIRASWLIVVIPTLSLLAHDTVRVHNQAFPGLPAIASPFESLPLAGLAPALADVTLLYSAVFVTAFVFQVMRYRKAPIRERKQVRWVLFAGVVGILFGILPAILEAIGIIEPLGHTLAVGLFTVVPFLLFPASVVVAVMEPPWVDIDIVIRKSFVYGILSFLILVTYIGAAAAFGMAAGARLQIEVAIVLTVLVALAIQPARRRLQVVADKWVFGVRPTKYEAVAELGETIEQASDPTELLPQLAETIKTTLNLEWARATLDDGASATAGPVVGVAALSVDIGFGDDHVGAIDCGPKLSGSIDDDESQLVKTLAGQVGLAVVNARLAGRIVNAAETERRRIERNIHDGAQQDLVALVAHLGMARGAASSGELTEEEIIKLQREAQRILGDLRDLAQGIHPSVLTDGGILEAVEERCTHIPIDVSVVASPEMRSRRYDDDIEGAAYFFVTESLANVLKHAGASKAEISVTQTNGHLVLGVSDDGSGFDVDGSEHTGLAGLDDRIRALGGKFEVRSSPESGTTLEARLPVTKS